MEIDDVLSAAQDIPRSWAKLPPGEQLRRLRAARGVSQRLMGWRSEVSQADISRIENGADARWGTWMKLYAALGFIPVLAPMYSDEEAEEFMQDERGRRQDRMEEGRTCRW